jgi:hypothetical protein
VPHESDAPVGPAAATAPPGHVVDDLDRPAELWGCATVSCAQPSTGPVRVEAGGAAERAALTPSELIGVAIDEGDGRVLLRCLPSGSGDEPLSDAGVCPATP